MLQEQRDNSRGAGELHLEDHLNGFGDLTLVFALKRLKKVIFQQSRPLLDKCEQKGKMKTFIVYDLDSKMPVAVGEQVSAETARYCASEITGTFHANLFAEEIDLGKKLRMLYPDRQAFLKSWR